MNLSTLLEHWSIVENPFRGEEARHDSVFARMGSLPAEAPPGPPAPGASGAGDSAEGPTRIDKEDTSGPGLGASVPATVHPDFEKILGEPDRSASAIVFGEKGSGKTAMRLQLGQRIAAFNAGRTTGRALLVAYDDLNQALDRLHARLGTGGRGAPVTPDETLRKVRQVDHLDAILGLVVPRVVDSILDRRSTELDLGADARRTARRLDPRLRRELLLLQALYDRPAQADARTGKLRRTLRIGRPRSVVLWTLLVWLGWLPAGAVVGWAGYQRYATGAFPTENWLAYLLAGFLGVWLLILAKGLGWDWIVLKRIGRRLRRQIRVQARSELSYAGSLRHLDPASRESSLLPITESDEARYAMVQRLRRVLAPFGYDSVIVVVDRVDEPTLVSGDPERMRSVVWPMLNNKFLQQEGVAFKLLLPIELRHALFKESSAFFQEARLDKQNLIERLTWTGSMLYDLCEARLRACRPPPPQAPPMTLVDLFAEDVTRQDLVDALDQMHQPRDAFKLLYHCLTEHCSNVTTEQGQWKIPRLVLETVRKHQSDRVQQLYRGIRPA